MVPEVTIFAYAPVGLGHLRVTDALYEGLENKESALLLKTHDSSMKSLHRITSINPLGKAIGEFVQYGFLEDLFTVSYRYYLRHHTKKIYEELMLILEQRFSPPKTVLIVATHFALAHQFAAIKKRVEREKGIKIFLAVQVTDDSPQHVWYVPGADVIFVPSEETKKELEKYRKFNMLPKVNLVSLPYPISPYLYENLNERQYKVRISQLNAKSKTINVSVPVSGAAAGIDFHIRLSELLHKSDHRFRFHFVSRSNEYTLPFLKRLLNKNYVKVYASVSDRQVVNFYDELYTKQVIAIEITKPSEQAFKALLCAKQRGGATLFFSQTFGRQEKDNLRFLMRNNLIPDKVSQKKLFELSRENKRFEDDDFEKCYSWRGLVLPVTPEHANQFVLWCFRSGLLKILSKNSACLAFSSTELFWREVNHRMEVK